MAVIWYGQYSAEVKALIKLLKTGFLDSKDLDITKLINAATLNKMDHYLLSKMKDTNTIGSSKAKALFETELHLTNNISSLLQKIIPSLSELPWMTMKSFLSYPQVDPDLDIVCIDQSNFTEYKNRLASCGYKIKPEFSKRSHWREPFKQHLYPDNFTPNDKTIPYIHLHKKFSWNGMTFFNSTDLWNKKKNIALQQGHKISIPGPTEEILITAAHAIYENKYISLGDFIHCNNLCKNNTIHTQDLLEKAQQWGWKNGFVLFWDIFTSFLQDNAITLNVSACQESTPNSMRLNRRLPLTLPYLLCQNCVLLKMIHDWRQNSWPLRCHNLLTITLFDPVLRYRYLKRMRRYSQ